MKNTLLIALILIALVMIYLGISANMIPPTLTGIGFIVIAVLFYGQKKQR
ncbi:MAG: hypothetical protein PHQ74_03840 [Crocinitomicaceae bacterium]|nr:hypothetical protein [Crocinitomicaceae bacterium]